MRSIVFVLFVFKCMWTVWAIWHVWCFCIYERTIYHCSARIKHIRCIAPCCTKVNTISFQYVVKNNNEKQWKKGAQHENEKTKKLRWERENVVSTTIFRCLCRRLVVVYVVVKRRSSTRFAFLYNYFRFFFYIYFTHIFSVDFVEDVHTRRIVYFWCICVSV